MPDLGHLREKTVILKMTGASRAVSTKVVSEEEDGLWFASDALFGELRGAYPAIVPIENAIRRELL